MPSPESGRRKCGICVPWKKWPGSRRKRARVREAVEEQVDDLGMSVCADMFCGWHYVCATCRAGGDQDE